MLHVLALEPYAALSHVRFLEGLARSSRHEVRVETLPPRHWKWRMRAASLHFARVLRNERPPDVLLVSDYLNLAETLSLLPAAWREVPAVVYFHENQLTYPLQEGERRDVHFALTHLHSILAAREAWFNSAYHLSTFRAALGELVARIPEIDASATLAGVDARSRVEPLGVDVAACAPRPGADPVVVLWNHRWEYDKDPEALLRAARHLARAGLPFRLRVLGERFRSVPPQLAALREELGGRFEDLGFLEDRAAYEEALRSSDVVLATARHEFFGLATAEAVRAGCLPVLPDALAYPELLPPEERGRDLFLRPPDAHPGPALERAVRAARDGAWLAERRRVVHHAARFDWEARAPAFDAAFERVTALPRPAGRRPLP